MFLFLDKKVYVTSNRSRECLEFSPRVIQPVLEERKTSFGTVGRDGVTASLYTDESHVVPVLDHSGNVLVEQPWAPVLRDRSIQAFHPALGSHEWYSCDGINQRQRTSEADALLHKHCDHRT